MSETKSEFATCACQHCGGHIEFDVAGIPESGSYQGATIGQTVECPHCHLSTVLSVLQSPSSILSSAPELTPTPVKTATPPPPPLPIAETPTATARRRATAVEGTAHRQNPAAGVISIILLSLCGCALVANGFSLQTESAMHQIYAAI